MTKILAQEYKQLKEDAQEGFIVNLVKEDDLFLWEVALFGPPGTIYQGGYFKAHMQIPVNYPFEPPSFKFLSKMWHPNIFETGEVCISILDNEWTSALRIEKLLISIISLLNEPNSSNAANVDASRTYLLWRQGDNNLYEDMIKHEVAESRAEADKDGVVVPLTVEQYCAKHTSVEHDDLWMLIHEFNSIDSDSDLDSEDEAADEDVLDV